MQKINSQFLRRKKKINVALFIVYNQTACFSIDNNAPLPQYEYDEYPFW